LGGKQRVLDTFAYLDPDCKLQENVDIMITKASESGTAVIETREGFANYGKDNVRSKCNDKKMRLPFLVYKAGNADDTFEVTTIGSTGAAFIVRYTIKIVTTEERKARK
jgi:hypothetical protein